VAFRQPTAAKTSSSHGSARADVRPARFALYSGRFFPRTPDDPLPDKFWFGANGLPHTTQLHTIERFRRTDMNTLAWDITIDDPGAYAKPFTVETKAHLEPTWELMEYICQENETSASQKHIRGLANSPTSNGGTFAPN
jgi:hypothetical protein